MTEEVLVHGVDSPDQQASLYGEHTGRLFEQLVVLVFRQSFPGVRVKKVGGSHSELLARQPELAQVLIGISVLLLGAAVYVLGRNSKAYFLPVWLYAAVGRIPIFEGIGNHLPSLSHTCAFTLFTSAVVWPWPSLMIPTCLMWFIFECLLEAGQIDVLAHLIIGYVPNWFDGVPVLEATSRYFLDGTFDPLDVLSIALGSLAAYSLMRVVRRQEDPHVASN